MGKFDYDKAEADLYDIGCHHPEDVFEHTSEKGFNSYMREHGLNPEKYYKENQSSRNYGNSGTEGCYITTACVSAKGLSDDCEELNVLRYFRDNYLKNCPSGKEDISTYYKNAPAVVSAVNALPNATEIWERVYLDMIRPCVELIKDNKMPETYALYKKYVKDLTDRYLH